MSGQILSDEPVIIERRRITAPPEYKGDGLGLTDGRDYIVRSCIIDLSLWPLDYMDESASVTKGSSARFENCVIRGAGKLFLTGCGDADWYPAEKGKSVTFYHCILEDFGRRGPEVQDGMYVGMRECLIRNWGITSRFDTRSFAGWAHNGGYIWAQDCVFWQDKFRWSNFFKDLGEHIGQAWNDEGLLGVLRPSTWIPGQCKALFATDGGKVRAENCYKNKWWLRIQGGNHHRMDKKQAIALIEQLEAMKRGL